MCIKRLFLASINHSVIIFCVIVGKKNSNKENISPGSFVQTEPLYCSPLAHPLFSCVASSYFFNALPPPTVRQPTSFRCFSMLSMHSRSSPLCQFTTKSTFKSQTQNVLQQSCKYALIHLFILLWRCFILFSIDQLLLSTHILVLLNFGTTLENQIMHFKVLFYTQSIAFDKDGQLKTNKSCLANAIVLETISSVTAPLPEMLINDFQRLSD